MKKNYRLAFSLLVLNALACSLAPGPGAPPRGPTNALPQVAFTPTPAVGNPIALPTSSPGAPAASPLPPPPSPTSAPASTSTSAPAFLILGAGDMFVHVASASNIASNYTYIDHPGTNANPNQVLMHTQNWNPGGVGGTYNAASTGVWYDTSVQMWSVFNQDLSSMPVNAAFNLWVPSGGASTLVLTATASNIVSNFTYIDHPLANGNPNAQLQVTQNWNPGGIGGTYNASNIGVWYDTSAQKWAVFNQDLAAMPVNAAFNVAVSSPGTTTFVHSATGGNISEHFTYIDHPQTNNRPNALVFVTQNWNPGGVGGTYNNASIGVWYDASAQKWAIFNQDFAPMPVDAAFNILLANP